MNYVFFITDLLDYRGFSDESLDYLLDYLSHSNAHAYKGSQNKAEFKAQAKEEGKITFYTDEGLLIIVDLIPRQRFNCLSKNVGNSYTITVKNGKEIVSVTLVEELLGQDDNFLLIETTALEDKGISFTSDTLSYKKGDKVQDSYVHCGVSFDDLERNGVPLDMVFDFPRKAGRVSEVLPTVDDVVDYVDTIHVEDVNYFPMKENVFNNLCDSKKEFINMFNKSLNRGRSLRKVK